MAAATLASYTPDLSGPWASLNETGDQQATKEPSKFQTNPSFFLLLSVACIVVPQIIARTPLWPRLGTVERKVDVKTKTNLIPLTLSHLSGIFNVLNFLTKSPLFHSRSPVKLQWLNFSAYIVQGASNIRTTFQNKSLSTFFFQGIFVHRVFLLPRKDLGLFWTEEEEEEKDQPTKYGVDEIRNDFGSRSAHHISNLLSGPGTKAFNAKFDEALGTNLENLHEDEAVHEISDLKEALDMEIVRSFIDTLCGPYLLQQNPDFLEDWQHVHDNITLLFLKFPRFIVPAIFKARDRCLQAVEDWNRWATAKFTPESLEEDGIFDPYWGHSFFRERTAMYLEVDKFPFSSIAAHNLGLLWGGTANSSPAAFWAIFEVARDPEMLDLVRKETSSCLVEGTEDNPRFDMDKLLKKPILQAIIAETLRLRVHGIIPRKTPVQGVSVHGALIPGHKLFFMNSTTEHLDPKVWCTGTAADHPPEEFWPGRFLLPPTEEGGEPIYSINGKSGSWLPFGGGAHMCPGRFLAKRIMTGCIAHVVTRYECEVMSDSVAKRGLKGMSLKTFGLGTLHPSERVPVRLTPRKKE